MKDDAKFVVFAADAELYEAQIANMAKLNAYSGKATELANEMLNNNIRSNEELTLLAAKKSIAVPTAISKKHQRSIYSLLKFKDQAFDIAFSKKILREYSYTIELFQKEANNGKDLDLKNWAIEQLQILKHLSNMTQNILDDKKVKETVKK
jgi:putative membrane protein